MIIPSLISIMKKALRMIKMVIMAILMSVSFSSCGSDSDDDPISSNELVGTEWMFKDGNDILTLTFTSTTVVWDEINEHYENKYTWDANSKSGSWTQVETHHGEQLTVYFTFVITGEKMKLSEKFEGSSDIETITLTRAK